MKRNKRTPKTLRLKKAATPKLRAQTPRLKKAPRVPKQTSTTVALCLGTRGVFARRVVRARNFGNAAFFRRITFGVLLVLFIFYLLKSVM